jgi:hypothetical protein
MPDLIEFYDGDRLLKSIHSHIVPTVGSFLSLRSETWKVISVTYAIDHADRQFESQFPHWLIDMECATG